MDTTDYRELRTYALGDENWDHTDTVQAVEADLPITDVLANRPTGNVPVGRKFLAEDVRILYQYRPTDNRADGDGWVPIAGAGSPDEPVYGTRYLENLEVTQGLTSRGDAVATRRSTKTLDVLEYGDPTDADTAVDAAEADADPGDTLLFRDATFAFTTSHTFTTPVDLEFVDAVVEDNRPDTMTAGETLFRWEGPGSQAQTTLSTAVRAGNSTITVGATGFASVGDTLYLTETVNGEPRTQFATVQAVTEDATAGTSDLTLSGVTRREFGTTAEVHRVELWDRIRVAGPDVATANAEGELFAFKWCHRPRVRDVLAREIGRHVVQFSECYDPTLRDSEARNAHLRGSGQGEPFICFRSTDVTFSNCRTQGTRRGIDVTLGTTGVTILEPHIEDYTKGGVSVHDGDDVEDITVIGGEIHSTEGSDAACISLAGKASNVSVYGTNLVAHREAIYVSGAADIRDVSITLAELPSADPQLITVEGNQVSISADVHIPVYESYTSVADVEAGFSNVDLDLSVTIDGYNAGGNHNPLVQVSSGASDVTLTGTIDSVADLSSPAVRLYGSTAVVENVALEDLTVVDHGGQAVQFRGNQGVRSVRVSGCYFDVAGDGVRWYQYDDLLTCENFWIRDNEILSATGTGVNVAAAAADTVRILDNEATVAVADGATNIIRHRAETDKDETVTGAWTFGGTLEVGAIDSPIQHGLDPAETIVETTAPTSWNFGGTDTRDIHQSTDVTLSNGSTASATEDVTVDLYAGADTTGTLLVSETRAVTVAAGATVTETFIASNQALGGGTYHVEISTSGTTLVVDEAAENTRGATHTFDQDTEGRFSLLTQFGAEAFNVDPITGAFDPNTDLSALEAKPHSALDDAPPAAHHARYADEEAQDAVGTILSTQFNYDDATPGITIDPHVTDAAAHHTRFTEAATDALADIPAGNRPHSALDDAPPAAHHARYTDAEAQDAAAPIWRPGDDVVVEALVSPGFHKTTTNTTWTVTTGSSERGVYNWSLYHAQDAADIDWRIEWAIYYTDGPVDVRMATFGNAPNPVPNASYSATGTTYRNWQSTPVDIQNYGVFTPHIELQSQDGTSITGAGGLTAYLIASTTA